MMNHNAAFRGYPRYGQGFRNAFKDYERNN